MGQPCDIGGLVQDRPFRLQNLDYIGSSQVDTGFARIADTGRRRACEQSAGDARPTHIFFAQGLGAIREGLF